MNTCTEQTLTSFKSGDAHNSSANDARSAIMSGGSGKKEWAETRN